MTVPDNPGPAYPEPTVDTLADAKFWINVMHRRTCQDAESLYHLLERTDWLALPWWRRAWRKPPWQKRTYRDSS